MIRYTSPWTASVGAQRSAMAEETTTAASVTAPRKGASRGRAPVRGTAPIIVCSLPDQIFGSAD